MNNPACATACGKSGINTAWPVRKAPVDYLHAQQLGARWWAELTRDTSEQDSVIEAIHRARDNNLQFILIPHCEVDDYNCDFRYPNEYARFLRNIDAQVAGPFWAVIGPVEPDSIGTWAGDATELAAYMNTVLDGTTETTKLRTISPAFNLTNGTTDTFFATMEAAGARFGDLDALGGTSYTVAGNGAYYYYASNTAHSEKMRQKAIRFGKPFIFVEYGTFDLLGHETEGDPRRVPVINQMQHQFTSAANDSTVLAILHFNAFGHNPGFSYHRLYDPEIVSITSGGNSCVGSSNNSVGVGYSTQNTLWQLTGESTCREVLVGCPFDAGVVCPDGTCIDNDGDGFYGEGGACVRNDCNDSDPAVGLSCGGAATPQDLPWGTLSVIETSISPSHTLAKPAISIRANNTPIIIYHDSTLGRGDLNALDCLSADCSVALRRSLASKNLVGAFHSMAVLPDGRPITAYLDMTQRDLRVFVCNDETCNGGQDRAIDGDTGKWDFGFATATVIRSSGLPLIAYWHTNNISLRLYDCSYPGCSAGVIRQPDTSAMAGYAPSIAIGRDGLPLVSYGAFDLNGTSEWQLRLWDCDNANCGYGSIIHVDDTSAETFWPQAMAQRKNFLPVILYFDRNAGQLLLFDCQTENCSTGVSHNLMTIANPTSVTTADASMAVLPDGNPFIAFSQRIAPGDFDMTLIRCFDPSCAQSIAHTLTAGTVGSQPNIGVRPNGNPVVAMADEANSTLALYDVDLWSFPGCPAPSDWQLTYIAAGGQGGHSREVTLNSAGEMTIAYDGVAGAPQTVTPEQLAALQTMLVNGCPFWQPRPPLGATSPDAYSYKLVVQMNGKTYTALVPGGKRVGSALAPLFDALDALLI